MTRAQGSASEPASARSAPRVLLVTPIPPPVGGIGTWAETLLESSIVRDFDVTVLDTSPSASDALRGGNWIRFGRATASLRLLARAVSLLRALRPDLVHINSSYYWGFVRDGAIAWLASAFGARVLMHLHGGDFDVFLKLCPAPLRWLVLATLRRCDGVIVLTRESEALLAGSVGGERVAHLPNFVQASLFASASSPPEREPIEVLFVGWVIETKGVRELLQAARGLPQLRFSLVGPIDEGFREQIEVELEALSGRVRLLGRLPHDAVRALYSEFDVFVLPTYREGFPVSVLEAMAASLPVVATAVGAIADAVRDGKEGFLVPVRDAQALELRLRELADHPERRRAMGAAARERVLQHFDTEVVVAKLSELYRSLLGRAGA